MQVKFFCNIDFYRTRLFPGELSFRPMVGDRVKYLDQKPNIPVLEVKSVEYGYNGDDIICELWFNNNDFENNPMCKKILNHEVR